MCDSKKETSRTTSDPGSMATNGTGGAPSPSRSRVIHSVDSKPVKGGLHVEKSVAIGPPFFSSVSVDRREEGFTFMVSWDGLTQDQLLLIAWTLGWPGQDLLLAARDAQSGGAISSRSIGSEVRLSTVVSTR